LPVIGQRDALEHLFELLVLDCTLRMMMHI
jgi:hypothetical protein